MANKIAVVSASDSYQTVKVLAEVGAKVKGTPQLLNGKVVFPFDNYVDGDDHLYVYKAERCEVTAQGANTEIASVNFALFDKIYWDNAASKFTNIAAGNTLCGRCLVAVNYAGGVVAGNTLLIEFSPDVV